MVKISICLKFFVFKSYCSWFRRPKCWTFFGQNLKVLAMVSGAKTVKKDTFNHVTSHCSFTRLKPERIGSFSFALRLSRNPKPKDFLNFCEGFMRVGTVRGRSQTLFTRFGFFWPPTPSFYIFYGIKVYKKSFFLTTYSSLFLSSFNIKKSKVWYFIKMAENFKSA